MALLRRRATSRGESSYRPGSVKGVTYFMSRDAIDDVAIIAKRFPGPQSAPNERSFVMVHGIGVSSRYFHPLAAEMAKHGSVYVVDLPGYGRAPRVRRDMSVTDHAVTLGRFLNDTGLRNPVLIGHSMGAQIVSQLVFDRPGVTDRMVLLGPTVYPRHRSALMQGFNLSRDMLLEPVRSNAVVITDYLFRSGIPYYLRQLPHLVGDQIETRLPVITAKTLVVRGNRDPIVPRAWAQNMVRLLPNATYAEVPGPHVILFTAPAELATLIAAHAS